MEEREGVCSRGGSSFVTAMGDVLARAGTLPLLLFRSAEVMDTHSFLSIGCLIAERQY